MHTVAVLALNGFVPFDLSIPCEVFGRVRTAEGAAAYRVRVCGEASEVGAGAFSLRVPGGLEEIPSADTVVVAGIEDPLVPVSPAVLDAIRAAWNNGARLASICSGAFVLAATGLLDGRRATTHWLGTAALARLFPNIQVDPQVLFVDEGRIITAAGSSAGLDMCLHLVRRDHGQAIAARAARMAVAPLDRDGGQSQFIRYEPPGSSANLAPLLDWMRVNAHLPLGIDALAARACVSSRTLARRFREQTGTTPLQWLIRTRILLAQELLETSSRTIDEIAAATGFESSVTLRARFQKIVGVSPSAYRRRFNSRSEDDGASPPG